MFYIQIIKLKFKETIQYRVAFINNLFAQFFAYMVTFINLSILLKNIKLLDGWSIKEILLLWTLNVFSYGIAWNVFLYNGCNALEDRFKVAKWIFIILNRKAFLLILCLEILVLYLFSIFVFQHFF